MSARERIDAARAFGNGPCEVPSWGVVAAMQAREIRRARAPWWRRVLAWLRASKCDATEVRVSEEPRIHDRQPRGSGLAVIDASFTRHERG